MKHELRLRDSLGWPLLTVMVVAISLTGLDLFLEQFAPRKSAQGEEQRELVARIMKPSPASPEALAIAERFDADTLPRLLLEGVVRHFSQENEKTILRVDEKLWANKGTDIRLEILMEMMISTRVKGFMPVAEVRDYATERLMVDIHLPDKVVYYD
ncbi:MAG: hypothetical protein WD182_02640 [Bacteroidota bacterium]